MCYSKNGLTNRSMIFRPFPQFPARQVHHIVKHCVVSIDLQHCPVVSNRGTSSTRKSPTIQSDRQMRNVTEELGKKNASNHLCFLPLFFCLICVHSMNEWTNEGKSMSSLFLLTFLRFLWNTGFFYLPTVFLNLSFEPGCAGKDTLWCDCSQLMSVPR